VLDGRVLFDSASGIDLPSRARRVGLLFQHYGLFPHLTVERNIAFGLRHLAGITPEQTAQRAARQVAEMHLSGLERQYPGALSGGQQQRVALARALAPQPAALLLDEPFSALDTHLRSQLERQLRETLARYGGVTLLVSHNLEEIYRLCSYLVVLDKGQVIAGGAREEMFHRPPNRTTARLTGCKNFSRARTLPDVKCQGRDGCKLVEALDWGCQLRVTQQTPRAAAHVAIRAHHIGIEASPPESVAGTGTAAENTFPCWLADSSEAPFHATLFLRLNGPPATPADYHLQVEIARERWVKLKGRPFPWHAHLEPDRLFLLPD
jgi:molybdate transport system permease protein